MSLTQEIRYQVLRNKLTKLHQEHLLNNYYNLSSNEQISLLNDINIPKIKKVSNLYHELIENSVEYDQKILSEAHDIKPAAIYWKNNLSNQEKYFKIGEKSIKNNEVAVVLFAGGMGSRLGFNGPKGTFELLLGGNKLSLFEIFINKCMITNEKYFIVVPIYIMCSNLNYQKTKDYFINNNYFNYPKDKIRFFIQDDLPLVSKNGKVLMKDKSHLLYGSNGNGDVFKALDKYKYFDLMEKEQTKWLIFTGIDNILIDLIDPLLIGLTIDNNFSLASKSISKKTRDERGYVFGRQNNKFYMLENGKITEAMRDKKDENGNYLYRECNIGYYLVSFSLAKKLVNCPIGYNSAFKYVDYLGNTSKEKNAYKFEKFVYKAFYQEDNMLVLSVSDNEFSPLKNKEGIQSIKTVQEDYLKKYNE